MCIRDSAGIGWDSVVEKVWKDMGGNQEEILSIEKFAGVQDIPERDGNKTSARAKN